MVGQVVCYYAKGELGLTISGVPSYLSCEYSCLSGLKGSYPYASRPMSSVLIAFCLSVTIELKSVYNLPRYTHRIQVILSIIPSGRA